MLERVRTRGWLGWLKLAKLGIKSLDSQDKCWRWNVKVLSLIDIMLMFNADYTLAFLKRYEDLARLCKHCFEGGPNAIKLQSNLQELLESYSQQAKGIGLNVTAGLAHELSVSLLIFLPEDLEQRLMSLQKAFGYEIGSHKFAYLDNAKSDYLGKEAAFGKDVADSYPSSAYDIAEACNCYALDRSTACVFHLMRALEVPIACIRRALEMKDNYPAWGTFLKAMTDANWNKYKSKSDPNYLFFADLEGQFWAIKNAWRDETMHSVTAKYTETEAQNIFRAIEGVMRKAATNLREQPTSGAL